MILKKGPLPSMPGNLVRGADVPETEGVLRKLPAPIPQIPPEDNFAFNEIEDPPIGHIQNPLPVAEGVTIRRTECSQRQMQRCLELQQPLAEGTVSCFTAHKATAPMMCQDDLILKELEQDPVAFEITSNQDTPDLHEAMLTQYAAQIRKAMRKEVKESTWKGPWWVIEKSDVPSSSKI
jgi:hypothetical protein